MFIQTETTPNPATLKFLPGKVVMPEGTADFRDAASAGNTSPLAAKLFAVPGITGVFFGYDFITVTKEDSEWQHLKPAILGTIMEHFMSGAPVMAENAAASASHGHDDEEFFDEADTEIVGIIKELLDTRVRPAVAQDGGDITFRGFENGTVFLHMKGACSGCPSSTATLKHGIQNLLRHFVPEVQQVEQI
ncbi:NifU family protein [Falsochrobactrum sp. TDYN1]|uniref:NifU family protein n=1 Tax=Falsochrobactrum tianjinense TaxID=2706015 RepID=A0A949PKR3_9HYPH|nr:NifU family protein [Falsochrobactrum sp. TDYN1]MBV2142293.1 NifU family protein [Falsochrobactrum sp. TDYN1]